MKIVPCENWVFFEAKMITKIGRLELPDTAQRREESVSVLEVGPKVKKIKKGDRIVITFRDVVNHGKAEDGAMQGFVREEDVIAKVD